jgi:hypothetical protein
MPLHRHKFISLFRQNLITAVSNFIQKDETLVETAILTVLKYWPVVNPTNEVASLSEIETYLNLLKDPSPLTDLAYALVERVAICSASLNWMVAERAL